jgi:hypothetical protein
MKGWLKKLIFPNREYFYGMDWGKTGDHCVIVEGYKDKKGIMHITKVDVLEEK